jgi:hypothetical protein
MVNYIDEVEVEEIDNRENISSEVKGLIKKVKGMENNNLFSITQIGILENQEEKKTQVHARTFMKQPYLRPEELIEYLKSEGIPFCLQEKKGIFTNKKQECDEKWMYFFGNEFYWEFVKA